VSSGKYCSRLDAQHQALEHGAKIAGCTLHFVDDGLDSGPIVAQAAVPVLDDDTAESPSARILRTSIAFTPKRYS
jgi:phosphoribosylglycinamide formyltransferase-1